jgi:hypothetical protein
MLIIFAKPIYRMWREGKTTPDPSLKGGELFSLSPYLPCHSFEKVEDIDTVEIVFDAKILDKGIIHLEIAEPVSLDREHPRAREIRLFLSQPND